MATIDDIVAKVCKYNPSADIKFLREVYLFAEKAHAGQYRASGEPYITHPLEIAAILAGLELDVTTIAAAMLHDVVEDTTITLEDICKHFGDELASLVDGVTKLSKIAYKSKEEQQAENMRKMFLAMAKDLRVILIKLADRLHNMRTLKSLPESKQKEIAQETLEIFAPIANRLGIYRIKWELEDLALRYLDTEMYYFLVDKVAKKRKEREEYIQSIIKEIQNKLSDVKIKAQIEGRPKHFFSIYEKITKKGKDFSEIYDLIGIRVLVDTVKDCYGALGIIHTLWKPIPGRFKDYIAMPKPNFYQSLHTTVIGPQGEPLEIQIRTYEMHRIAENGIAAHWKYKERGKIDHEFEKKLRWIREMADLDDEARDAREFMEGVKMDFFSDEVFVFTPKGDVIDLPYGSIPLDFAYLIHTDIGHRCIGAKVNGKIVPIDTKLNNGDIVEILTSKSGGAPSRDWLKIVKTSQAKNKIRQWFKRNNREENIARGRELFEKELRKNNLDSSEIDRTEILTRIAQKMKLASVDELFAGIGHGSISIHPVLNRWAEEIKKVKPQDADADALLKVGKRTEKGKRHNGVIVEGISDVLVRFSKCCNPVPGDEIVGYVTRGRGVSIHRKDCPNIAVSQDNDDRLVNVNWAEEESSLYQVRICVEVTDRQGLLAEIISAISEFKVNISAIEARPLKNRTSIIHLSVEVHNKEQVSKLIARIKKINAVHEVERAPAK